ncbi:TetR/AcrR family transcriptional regulator [Streptomyces sp. KM273126]|uniref:TetR/AcrR family transcriptional regulator n=1 Tax=Streptomyces sp. KM273126 TaxID=2545247 RepID=UPI00103D7D11|nr:TetR family transcriptional regulator [Streptomyces sp. KM273126]MBA2809741.1 TetR/AcrR family transcriptional regulator [Streptomyces sp. KM273126]
MSVDQSAHPDDRTPDDRTPDGRATPGRRGYAKGKARREEIVRTALRTFAEQGYRSTSMREIAEAVGLSQAGLLHHFRNKDDLLTEVLRLRDAEQSAFNRALAEENGMVALRRLVDLMELNATQAGLVRLYTVLRGESVGGDHPAQPYFAERFLMLRERVAGYLRHARDVEGVIRADVDVLVASTLIMAVMDGLQTQWLLAPDAVDLAGDFARFMDDYLRGLS